MTYCLFVVMDWVDLGWIGESKVEVVVLLKYGTVGVGAIESY
jgi:hypothetical protein